MFFFLSESLIFCPSNLSFMDRMSQDVDYNINSRISVSNFNPYPVNVENMVSS